MRRAAHPESDSKPAGVTKLTPAAAAKRIGKTTGRTPHISTVIRWIKRGAGGRKLPAIRQGNNWLIDPADADAYVQVVNATPGSTVARNADAAVGAQLASIMGTRWAATTDGVVEVTVSAGAPVSVKGTQEGAR